MTRFVIYFFFQVQTGKLTLLSHSNASTHGFWFEKESCLSQCVECAESKLYTQLNIPLYSHGLVCHRALGSQSLSWVAILHQIILLCAALYQSKDEFSIIFMRCSSLYGFDSCCNYQFCYVVFYVCTGLCSSTEL